MKQTVLMLALEFVATIGMFVDGPFIAVAVYYLFGVLRPQFLWEWALPAGIPWSEIPAIAAVVGVVAYVFNILPMGERRDGPFRGFSSTHVAFLAFALWIGVTYVTALNREVAWPWLLEYLKILLMFVVAAFVVRTVRHAWWLYLVATGSLAYIAYEMNSTYIFDGRLDIYRNGYGGLDNNGAALMLAMGVPLALSAWEGTRRLWRWLFLATIPLLLHAVLMSYSRGAMLSLLIVVPLLALRTKRRWQFLAVAAALASMLPVLAGEEIRHRFFSIEDYEVDRTSNTRFQSWQAAIRIANDSPIFGVGVRNANLLSLQYGADMEGRTIHSQYFQILADQGYVGLSLYLFVILSFFQGLRRARRALKGRDDQEAILMRAMVNGLECCLAVFCVGASFLSLEVFELPYLTILLGAQLGLLSRSAPVAVTAGRELPGSGELGAYSSPQTYPVAR